MRIEIDSNSGFCYGVVKTIELAEKALNNGTPVYCLGEIVHNEEEVERLKSKGLIIIENNDLEKIQGSTVLIRAHGEPPATYREIASQSNTLKEGTCPIVLNLQKKIRLAWEMIKDADGQVVIYGKKDHAEVIGLAGQVEGKSVIISHIDELDTIDFSKPVALFSQTTQSPEKYQEIGNAIRQRMEPFFLSGSIPLKITNSICGHVSKRGEYLKEFANQHDVIVFVSGTNSSNGKVLFEICRTSNPKSYWVPNADEVKNEWFTGAGSVGICGATSTPRWLMEKVAEKIKELTNEREDNLTFKYMAKINRIGVLTSGGDAPGMNAAIRAVTRTAIYNNIEVYGINRGYEGMIEGDFVKLQSKDVSGIIQKGGTILKTARSARFRTPEGRQEAYENLRKYELDGIVVIGGDGSFTGASILSQEFGIPVIGIPGTIDNDLYGTDYTIGYDTCLNTVVDAVDKIRDTASSHNRIFFVEVMGRDAGFVALEGGIATGAEVIMIPEVKNQMVELRQFLSERAKSNRSSIIVVAEGDDEGSAIEIAAKVQPEFPQFDIRVTILGHIQRGGSPSCYDRVSASRLGVGAVEALLDDQKSIMVGIVHGQIVHVPLSKTVKTHKGVPKNLLDVAHVLAI